MDRCFPRIRRNVWAVTAVLAGVAGCHQIASPSMIPGMSAGADEPAGKLKPKQGADVQIALARTLELHGDNAKALALYEEAVKKDPSRGDAWLRLAVLHDRMGQFAESAILYQKALRALPGNAEIYCDMGYSLYLQRRWSEAEMNLRQAVLLQPDHARAHNNLGMLLARAGQTEEALDEFYKAGCNDADAHINLAFALTLEQHWPEARQQYQQALQADPSSIAANKGLRELEHLLARMGSALGASPDKASVSPVAQAQCMNGTPSPSTYQAPGSPSPAETIMPR